MRLKFLLLLLPITMAACQTRPPAHTTSTEPASPAALPVVPPAPPPPEPEPLNAQIEQPLATQCQMLFVQSMAGRPVTFSTPRITAAGATTTIRIHASAPAQPSIGFTCVFDGTKLRSSGQG